MTILILAGWAAGWLLFRGLRRCENSPNGCNRVAEISTIIPARDEEENLPKLLRSIAQQRTAPLEVIVVDDCSSDRTHEVAQEFETRVIRGTPPVGWVGKTWACHQGVNAAKGDLLLFLDADTWLENGGLAAFAKEFRGGAMSIAPYHCVDTLREQFSCFFNLVMFAGAGERNLLGQSLLIDRSSYTRAGGYGAVKVQALENLELGRRISGQVIARLGRGVLNMRMYAKGWREMTDGWSKSFASGVTQTSRLRLVLIILWITGCVLAANNLITYALFTFQLATLSRRIGSYRLITSLFYPLPLLYFLVVFVRSILRMRRGEGTFWKGRLLRAA